MLETLLEAIYKHYPKGINYLDSNRNANPAYTSSQEHELLEIKRTTIFPPEGALYKQVSQLFAHHFKEFEVRELAPVDRGERAYALQHSGIFFRDELKYYPVCFAFSSILPLYCIYVCDIDIGHIEGKLPIRWKKKHEPILKWEQQEFLMNTIDPITHIIKKELNFKRFPNALVYKTIPDISSNNLEHGEMTFFNAFFLDEFYCLP